jgi:YkoY family integral membrane protein
MEILSLELRDYPLVGWYILVLVFLEGLLSADNALVLAVMVRHLPKNEQKRVLRYGIWGAVVFRLVAVLLSAILIRFWYFKVFGGLYLLYLSIAHFLSRKEQNADSSEAAGGVPGLGKLRWLRGFWGTVTSVTLTDIAFSIDSILAAVALAVGFPERFGPNGKMFIVFVGGVLGIITMRFVVRYFVTLLDRFPGLAEGAFYLVAWIGIKLVVSGIHDRDPISFPYHIPEVLFWSVMLAIAVFSIFVKPRGAATDHRESLELLESEEESDDEGPSDSRGATNGTDAADRVSDSDGSHLLRSGPSHNPAPGQSGS